MKCFCSPFARSLATEALLSLPTILFMAFHVFSLELGLQISLEPPMGVYSHSNSTEEINDNNLPLIL